MGEAVDRISEIEDTIVDKGEAEKGKEGYDQITRQVQRPTGFGEMKYQPYPTKMDPTKIQKKMSERKGQKVFLNKFS